MLKPSKDVTAAELAILEQLWEHKSATLKELSGWLYGSTSASDIFLFSCVCVCVKDLCCVKILLFAERNSEF